MTDIKNINLCKKYKGHWKDPVTPSTAQWLHKVEDIRCIGTSPSLLAKYIRYISTNLVLLDEVCGIGPGLDPLPTPQRVPNSCRVPDLTSLLSSFSLAYWSPYPVPHTTSPITLYPTPPLLLPRILIRVNSSCNPTERRPAMVRLTYLDISTLLQRFSCWC